MEKENGIISIGIQGIKTHKVRPGPILMLVLLLTGFMVNAQTRTITGSILAEDGTTMPGVTVSVEGTNQGVISDVDGRYSISITAPADFLVFSFVGMRTERIQIAGRSVIDVVMTEDLLNLEEVVVIGYGTIKKEEVTSAVSSVKSDNFNLGSVSDAGQLIKGKVAGLSIVNSSGDPLEES